MENKKDRPLSVLRNFYAVKTKIAKGNQLIAKLI